MDTINFSCSSLSTLLMVPFLRRSSCFIKSRCFPTTYSVLPRHTRHVKLLYALFFLFPPFSFVFLMYPTPRPPFSFPLRSPSTMLLMCSPSPIFCSAHPPLIFFRLRVQITPLLRPLCCPMKAPLKCFLVKMFSILPLLVPPIPQFHRLLSSSSSSIPRLRYHFLSY